MKRAVRPMDVQRIRDDFPFYSIHDLVYLDNACQTLRPVQVIEAMDGYYQEYPACGGRSVHRLATRVSIAMERARESVSRLVGNGDPDQLIFTKNCTESLNMVSKGYPLSRGDVVVTTDIEHNSNCVPWLQMADRGVRKRHVSTGEDGLLDLEAFKEAMTPEVRMVSMVHTNNILGTTIPARDVVEIAHDNGSLVMLDGAQAAPHIPVDVESLDVDFYAFSLHKMLGPSGMGALYAKEACLESMEPIIAGGGTVGMTSYDDMQLLPSPDKFEAGLHNYAGIIGSGAAAEYLMALGMDQVREHDIALNRYLSSLLRDLPGVRILGPEDPGLRSSILSFNVGGLNPHDVAMALDEIDGVLVRSGYHCCHAYFNAHGIKGSVRASTYLYNDRRDCERMAQALRTLIAKLGK